MPSRDRDLDKYIDKTGLLSYPDGLRFSVLVLDAKSAYGRVRLLVEPTEGTGQVWVNVERVTFKGVR